MSLPTRTRARRKAERPTEILDAAFEQFVEHGYAATRLEDVAQLAGVTKGTIYFYFDTKERVFEEMIRQMSAPMFAEFRHYAGTLEGSYADRLRALLVFLYRRIVEDRVCRELLRFLIAEGRRFPELVDRHDEEFVQPFVGLLRSLLEDGIAAGEFRPSPAVRFAEIIISPAMLLNFWWLLFDTRKQIDIDEFIDAHVDLLLNGLAAPAHHPARSGR